MTSNVVIVIFFVFSLVTSALVGWRAGKTASNRTTFTRFRAVMITVTLFFTVVPLVTVAVSAVLAGDAESLNHLLNMWTAALFIVVGGIIAGSGIMWATLILSLVICLAAFSVSSRNSGKVDMYSEHQSHRLAKQDDFLWNIEGKKTQQEGGQ